MELTENTPVLLFEDPAGGDIIVVRACPKCGRFLRKGQVYTDLEGGNVQLCGWTCKRDGEVTPDWDRV